MPVARRDFIMECKPCSAIDAYPEYGSSHFLSFVALSRYPTIDAGNINRSNAGWHQQDSRDCREALATTYMARSDNSLDLQEQFQLVAGRNGLRIWSRSLKKVNSALTKATYRIEIFTGATLE